MIRLLLIGWACLWVGMLAGLMIAGWLHAGADADERAERAGDRCVGGLWQ